MIDFREVWFIWELSQGPSGAEGRVGCFAGHSLTDHAEICILADVQTK